MAFARPDQIRHARPARASRGQPPGLIFLVVTQMWERFAFFGTQALLMLFMARYLLVPEHAENVLGLGALKSALEGTSGPLPIEPLAAQIYGLYIALASLAPIIGGLIADRMLGQHRMVVIGAALTAVGDFLLAFDRLFLFALAILIIAVGAFRPSVAAQVGGLYAPPDARRDRGYAIFYVGTGIAALLAPPVCATLGQDWGWPYGFAAAGLAMLVGLAVYLLAGTALPPDARDKLPLPVRAPNQASLRRSPTVLLLVGVFLAATLMWAAYGQKSSTIALWADDHTDRTFDLLLWRGEIPVAVFQAFNPLLIVVFTPLLVAVWSWQGRRGSEPAGIAKMALGGLCFVVAYLLMAVAALAAAGDEASWWWLAGYFAALSIGELYFAPIGLSLISKAVPARLLSTMMGLWLAAPYAGSFLGSMLDRVWSVMDKAGFFLMVAGIAALAFGLMLACGWRQALGAVTPAPPPDRR
jgi:proton-dependent oligopeptide transporter, POT family